jgi:1-aminocyclopropane-1-carboxylate deaminase
VTEIVPDLKNICLDNWNHSIFRQNRLEVDVIRLDKIHPDISGNKWFKLKYYIEKAKQANQLSLASFGGAYSNHLLALAASARLNGFRSIGFIRGEEPSLLSHILVSAKEQGMELRFLSRNDYEQQKRSTSFNQLNVSGSNGWSEVNDTLLIPEGGAGAEGVRGSEEILNLVPIEKYTHICVAAGTGTTLAGLLNGSLPGQKLIGVSVLKGGQDLEPMDISWIKKREALDRVHMIQEDHFGGYAKYNGQLLDFMNEIFSESGIPTDFVYTGKLFFSVIRLAEMRLFSPGSRILVLHTGGLQGNRSLAAGLLAY